MSHYGKIEYWDERYNRQPEAFDWYQVFSGIKDIVTQYVHKTDKILNLGCGLSEEMYEEGYENIVNIDISAVVISLMEERYRDKCPNMAFKIMDAMDMSELRTGEFNAVIDKGTLDSILCGDNSIPNAEKMLAEVYRVLAVGGVYMCISYGDEEHRKTILKSQDWNYKVDKVAKPSSMISSNINPDEKDPKNFHYVYTLTKIK